MTNFQSLVVLDGIDSESSRDLNQATGFPIGGERGTSSGSLELVFDETVFVATRGGQRSRDRESEGEDVVTSGKSVRNLGCRVRCRRGAGVEEGEVVVE